MSAPTVSTQENHNVSLSDDRLWKPEEVAAFLGDIPVATLYRWRHQGTGPKARRIGKHLRYRPEDVRAWVAAQD
ncbi:helix-turn-helix transcriptional regulator [Actinomadura rudentiformis]|uniref:Helix-turn-helix domain-containing protein n=1 Tax=Actinomadura rudentiformis TaxID=359158 RepID=A0A6H9Z3K4_9ACTN|nr:helix-turn-helix domain-containing protein [Actinomadura rudentiformis]KAB2351621.1 helix-turn-helix domain-containing protein [Actinomadura rudentiformis]